MIHLWIGSEKDLQTIPAFLEAAPEHLGAGSLYEEEVERFIRDEVYHFASYDTHHWITQDLIFAYIRLMVLDGAIPWAGVLIHYVGPEGEHLITLNKYADVSDYPRGMFDTGCNVYSRLIQGRSAMRKADKNG